MLRLKILKHTLPFLFLFIIIIMSGGFILFHAYIYFQKEEFRETTLSKSKRDAVRLLFGVNDIYKNTNGVEWKELNKEVVVDGIYYEIISVKKGSTYYEVMAIEDDEENRLCQNYFTFEKASKDKLNKQLLSFMFLTYIPPMQSAPGFTDFLDVSHNFQIAPFTETSFHLKLNKPPTA